MTISDNTLYLLREIRQLFGIFGLAIFIIFIIFIYLLWKYLNRKSELIAESASEKSLKKFQFQIDKDLETYKTIHQKQVNTIHEIFQKFQSMSSLINFMIKGENFVQPMSGEEEITNLIKFRHEFKDIYQQNRLLLSLSLCNKIDSLIPNIDLFIQTYEGGLLPKNSSDDEDDDNKGYRISGIWSQNAFDEPLKQLDTISTQIESEFRKIFGTDI